MGNVNGRKDGGGSSGVKKFEQNYEPMLQLPPHDLETRQAPLMYISDPMNPSVSRDGKDVPKLGAKMSVKISWNHGGNQVAVIGSWDNWETREVLQNTGKEFIVIKTLPPGIHHYQFIVDGWFMCAPDLPWVSGESGNAFNILDLQVRVSDLPESLSDFESNPSPTSSYDNRYLNEDDFSEPPPELPPQLQETVPNEQFGNHGSLARHQHKELNHLYQSNVGGQFIALGSAQRFHQKYVTMFLFKPLRRTN